MKKFIFMMTMLFATLSMSAQHVEESGVFDNAYVSVSTGLTTPTTNWWWFPGGTGIDSNMRPMFQIEVGKAMNTYYTTAFEVDARVNTTMAKTAFDETTVSWLHKVNVLNVVNGYKERTFEMYPMFGLGWGHNFFDGDDYGVFMLALEFDWTLNDAWYILARPQFRWKHMENKFRLDVDESDWGVSVGVAYRFKNRDGGRGFNVCNYDELYAQNEFLNDEINKLRATVRDGENVIGHQKQMIDELNARKNEVKEIVIDNTVEPTVGFLMNEYAVTPDKMPYLYKVAEQYKDRKLVVVGYADKGTGTHKYNKELSLKRAEAVKDALVKLGLNADNIEVKAMGDLVQPFDENDMNRVVIIEK